MNFFVTGAAGFIGSHVCKKLAELGHKVTGVDNMSDYYSVDLKTRRVRHFLSHRNVSFQQLDLSQRNIARDLLSGMKFDSVIHLAAQPGVRLPKNQYWKYIQNNVVVFDNIITAAVDTGVANFLYASSSSVYGNLESSPFSEKAQGLTPVSFYGATKLTNEILTPAVIRGSLTRARGLRFFTVYGPWGRPDMAYFRILANAISGSPFSIFGDGRIIRDFTFIDDVVDSIVDLDQELREHTSAFFDVVNIGGGYPYSLVDMISEINRQTPIQDKFENKEFNLNDVHSTNADPTYLHSLIGKSPSTSLSEGIKRSIEWAKSSQTVGHLNNWVSSVY